MFQLGWIVGFGLISFGLLFDGLRKDRSLAARVILIFFGLFFLALTLIGFTW